MLIGATDKSGNKLPVVGQGEHTYEVVHDWGELPANVKYGNTHGVCEDSQGRIYIHHTVHSTSESHDSMVVFHEKGKFIKSWGKAFKGAAHGLHIRKEGRQEYLYLCDTVRGVVVKTTLDGEEVFSIGYPKESEKYKPAAGSQPATKYSPTNLSRAAFRKQIPISKSPPQRLRRSDFCNCLTRIHSLHGALLLVTSP